ncbi:MAG: serine/threonine-protein kinase [Archangium sp.]
MSADKGQTIGRYELQGVLAEGGMATVHLAQHVSNGVSKRVAIKQIHPHLSRDPSFVRMFLDEARIALQVNHPNVCSVHEVGVEEGNHYLVMEYLTGTSLSRVLKTLTKAGIRPVDHQHAVVRVIAEAAEGLHAAHEAVDARGVSLEIVHRDVSPQNLMITRDGAVKVVDFGIARTRERLERTDTGVVKGKAAYLSPEQIAGLLIDRRTDVWALGVCLWEALTLQNPFLRGNDPVLTMAAIATDPIEGPSGEGIHSDLNVIVKRAVTRDPKERYATAAQLSLALRAFLARQKVAFEAPQLARYVHTVCPQIATAPRFISTASKSGTQPVRSKRWPARAVLGASALALIVAGLVTTRVSGAEPEQSADTVVASEPVRVSPVRVSPVLVAKEEPPPAQPVARKAIAAPRRADSGKDCWLRVVSASDKVLEVRVNGVVRKTPASFALNAGTIRVELRELGATEFESQEVELESGIERTMRVQLD